MFRVISVWAAALLLSITVATAAPPGTVTGGTHTILVLGDSLSAGYGIRIEEGWVALLQARLKAQGYGYRLVNASVSGETTSGGLARLPRALELHRPAIVLIELGANDGLRGLPLETTERNLARMAELSRQARALVVLIGMRLPPNYGPRYTQEFHALFGAIARRHNLALVPFLLQDVALHDELMQADGLHPNAKAQPAMLDAVWPALRPLLEKGRRTGTKE